MENTIVINHSYSNGSIGGCYYANYYGTDKRVHLLNEAGMIDFAAPCTYLGSHGQAKGAVMETAQRIAAMTGAKVVDRTRSAS